MRLKRVQKREEEYKDDVKQLDKKEEDLLKKQKDFFESMKDDEHFIPKPESSDKSFFEKVKDMFS